MSRDWDGDDYDDNWALNMGRWERNKRTVLVSKRGQGWLRDLEEALLAMPDKRLCEGLATEHVEGYTLYGQPILTPMVCAVGQLALHKGAATFDRLLEDSWDGREATLEIAEHMGMAYTLAWLIGEWNDRHDASPEARYERVLGWVRDRLSQMIPVPA